MPPRPAVFAVGRELQPDLLLPADDVLDLAILDLAQRAGGNLAALAFGAGLFERRGTQQAADVIGAVGRPGSAHGLFLRTRGHCSGVRRASDLPATPRSVSSNWRSAASAGLGP